MKLILLSIGAIALLFQASCASRPSLEEQNRQELQTDQAAKKSDTFAKSLPQ